MNIFRNQNRKRTALYSNPCLEADYSPGRKTSLEGQPKVSLRKRLGESLNQRDRMRLFGSTGPLLVSLIRKYHRMEVAIMLTIVRIEFNE